MAVRAASRGEVPVGAAVVLAGRLVGTGHNERVHGMDPTAHAEIVALRAAARAVGTWRLGGAVLYVTLEPCLMCVGALLEARVGRVVFGCREPRSGALGSVFDIARAGPGRHNLEVTGGILAREAASLLQSFFAARRGA